MAYEMFNITNATSARNYLDFVKGTGEIVGSGNSLGMLILLMIFTVFFISLLRRGATAGKSLAASSWVTMIAAIALRNMELIGGYLFWIALILPGIAIFLLFVGTRD